MCIPSSNKCLISAISLPFNIKLILLIILFLLDWVYFLLKSECIDSDFACVICEVGFFE